MEFSKIIKYSAAVLFLALVIHSVLSGFNVHSTILCVSLAAVISMFELHLIKSERLEYEQRLKNIIAAFDEQINNISQKEKEHNKSVHDRIDEVAKTLTEKINNTDSKIQTMKLSVGMKQR